MYSRLLLTLSLILPLATAVQAQTKLSGEWTCPRADPQYAVEVGDQPEHVFQIGKTKCTTSKPPQVGGIAAVSDEEAFFSEVTGKTFRSQAKGFVTAANGDKIYYTARATGTPEGAASEWTMTGGTGKFAGITGKGKSRSTVGADGAATVAVEGTYKLAK